MNKKTAKPTNNHFNQSGHFLAKANPAAIAAPTASTNKMTPPTILMFFQKPRKNYVAYFFLFLNHKTLI